jgi:L-fuconolactonase
VDTGRADAPEELERWAGEGAAGVRLRPGDPLTVWRKADELALPVSVFGTADEFASPAFDDLLERFPSLPVIVEHLGRIGRVAGDRDAAFRKILALARHQNAYIKVHGLGEICPRPIPFPKPMRFPEIPPFMELAYEAFGPSRMMWGSDFPPVAGREGYRNALRWTMEHIPFRSDAEKEAVFGGTALSLFAFNG